MVNPCPALIARPSSGKGREGQEPQCCLKVTSKRVQPTHKAWLLCGLGRKVAARMLGPGMQACWIGTGSTCFSFVPSVAGRGHFQGGPELGHPRGWGQKAAEGLGHWLAQDSQIQQIPTMSL